MKQKRFSDEQIIGVLKEADEIGKRKEQHRNVIAAAKEAGVGPIAYTSILHADTSPLFLAGEHRATEAALAEAGVPFVLLRNSWYTEVFTWRLPLAMKLGTFMGAAGDGLARLIGLPTTPFRSTIAGFVHNPPSPGVATSHT